jgi:uncharacterized protein (DUF1684 family)
MPLLLLVLISSLVAAVDDAAHVQQVKEWRRTRVAELTADDGWLTLVGLYWLQPGVTRVGSGEGLEARLPATAPRLVGTLKRDGDRVTFTAAGEALVTRAGARVSSLELAPDEPVLVVGTYSMVLIKRGPRIGLRVRNRTSAARAAFRGLRYYPIAPALRVRARFQTFPPGHTMRVVNVLGDLVDFECPGQLVFEIGGATYRLDAAYETDEHKDLFVIFRDATSRNRTYPAGRYLHAPLPVDGVVDLDFNRAYNPPCAFTAFATCPIPPKQNWLRVPIEAGELAYHSGALGSAKW